MNRALAIGMSAAGLLTFFPAGSGAAAGDLYGDQSATASGGFVEVRSRVDGAHSGNQSGASRGGGSQPAQVVKWLPDCPDNNADTATIETCANAMTSCPEGIRMRRWTAPPGTTLGTPNWTSGASECRTAGEDLASTPTVLTTDAFQRLPLPAGTSHLQPAGDSVLIRMQNVVYTTSTDPVELTTTLAGQPVRVRATPVSWTWDFGDGTTIGPTKDPGHPYGVHQHAYTSDGTFRITLTTHYAGQYSVAGGPWLPVSGRAHVTSPARTVTVLTGTARLIDQP